MYSRDAHPSYVSVLNLRSAYFQFKLPGANAAPTLVYGSNWISPTLYGPGQVVPVTGNFTPALTSPITRSPSFPRTTSSESSTAMWPGETRRPTAPTRR